MIDPDRTPVVVSAAQLTARERDLGASEMAIRASADALSASSALPATIQRVSVVNILTRSGGPAPASAIAAALLLPNVARCETTAVGGCTPQWLIQRAAADIASGKLDATLIAGAEAVRSGRLRGTDSSSSSSSTSSSSSRSSRQERPTPLPPPESDPVIGQDRVGSSDEEIAAGLFIPVYVYPLLESAIGAAAGRGAPAMGAAAGRSPAEQRRFAAAVMAPLTRVAAAHPYAWFRDERTADEIATPTAENRLVAEPYTKLMTAFIGVSQAAALVMTSLTVARRLGLADGAMFVRSSATVDEVWYPSARPLLGASPAAGAAVSGALRSAGIGLDDFDHIDLYSCFPCAVEMTATAAGLALDDRRGLTVTGGLPYFGGPGNNYTTHAVATMFHLLRERPGSGLTTSVSWFMTTLAAGCYSSLPGASGFAAADMGAEQARIDGASVPVVRRGEMLAPARAVVDAGTVIYGRAGEVTAAPLVATLHDGRRVVAAVHQDDLAALAGVSLVGEKVEVAGDPAVARPL